MIKDIIETTLKTQHGSFRIICYPDTTKPSPDFALIHGDVENASNVFIRIQSECLTGHVLQSLSCDCYEQLQDSMKLITENDKGVLIYLRQEGRGIGLEEKLKSYILQKQGLDTVDANLKLGHKIDERDYTNAVKIIRDLNIESICLITNNPQKAEDMKKHGLNVSKIIKIPPHVREENRKYLQTKINKMGHTFQIDEE